jgi:hypothetical protein
MGFFDKKKDEPIITSPVEFVEDGNYREKAIGSITQDINNENGFAILRTTDNGKWVRGNMLFYSFNGVEIYTDIDNIIFVDTLNNALFIRAYSGVSKQIDPVDPEERQYIILYTDLGYDEADEGFPLRWESITGRLNAYESLKPNLSVIDIDKSIILVDTVTVSEALSVREFIKYLQNADMVDKYEIDIDSYNGSGFI